MLSRQALLRAARTAAPQRVCIAQARTYATPATSNANVKPPVAVFGLDGTYATALVRPPTLPSMPVQPDSPVSVTSPPPPPD